MKIRFLPLFLRSFATASACAVMAVSALAQVPAPAPVAPGTTPATPAAAPLGASDKSFIKNAGDSINYLTQMANTAKTLLTDARFTKTRDGLIKDLNKAWEAVGKIATAKGETLATDLSMADKTAVERLAKLKDERFAKDWADEMNREAKKLDKNFDSAARVLQDVDVKTFAANYGPLIRGVASATEKMEKDLKAPKKK